MKKIVIALGDNAIKQWNQKGSAEEQLENLRGSCSDMMKIIKKGYPIAITHGNGPQVGNLLIQQEKSAREVSLVSPQSPSLTTLLTSSTWVS